METIEEVFAKADILKDGKARRVVNVAAGTPSGLTAADIARGVTIEELEALPVPVFAYSTQVTIHGTVAGELGDGRAAGYKAIVRNGNGSTGVRYVAVDCGKKEALLAACDIANADGSRRAWHIQKDSQGYRAVKSFRDREEAARFPRGWRLPRFLWCPLPYAPAFRVPSRVRVPKAP